jgi:hypothetical protein
VAGLAAVTRPGGRYHMLCFSDRLSRASSDPAGSISGAFLRGDVCEDPGSLVPWSAPARRPQVRVSATSQTGQVTDERVRAATAHWAPRFVANGTDYVDSWSPCRGSRPGTSGAGSGASPRPATR